MNSLAKNSQKSPFYPLLYDGKPLFFGEVSSPTGEKKGHCEPHTKIMKIIVLLHNHANVV